MIATVMVVPAHAQSVGGSGLDAGTEVPQAADLLRGSDRNNVASDDALKPFGANLFNGGFSNDREDGLNPSYVVQPGDSVSVRIWGATQFNDNLTVDHQGNIFLPAVGPVKIAGTQNRDLNNRVADAVRTVVSDNVRVYTSLDGSQPVAVFVTGFVNNPGRFAGIPSNSALHFVDRAGGINPETGSYRNIQVKRNGELLAEIDLYAFLLNGQMPQVQYQDGDTIVVGARSNVVSVSGEISNPAMFEIKEAGFNGEALLAMALPAPSVSYVGVSGLRDSKPLKHAVTQWRCSALSN